MRRERREKGETLLGKCGLLSDKFHFNIKDTIKTSNLIDQLYFGLYKCQ